MTTEYLGGGTLPVETELQCVRTRDISLINFEPSSNNYSTTPLAGGATYTGTAEWNGFTDVGCSVYTDQDGTLYFEFQNPGSSLWHAFPPAGFMVSAGVHEFHTAVKLPRKFRVRYVNGSAAQSVFELYTYFGTFRQPSQPLNIAVSRDADSIVVRGTDFYQEVQEGRRTGYEMTTKTGLNEDVTGAEDIWHGGGDYTGQPADFTPETVDIFSASVNDASGGTGARTIRFEGLKTSTSTDYETEELMELEGHINADRDLRHRNLQPRSGRPRALRDFIAR